MIAENGEASGGAAGWFDLLIETKADPKQSHRETTNLFWYAFLENNPPSGTRVATSIAVVCRTDTLLLLLSISALLFFLFFLIAATWVPSHFLLGFSVP